MITLRHADDRGHANYGWLDSRHTFSFADYFDLAHMGFGALRVINDDRVAPGRGFGPHPHRDMEIISYLVSGALEHEDSMGHGSVIRAGEVQRMSAGTGVLHSEYNHSKSDPVHFLQIWIIPDSRGLTPGYEQKDFGQQRTNRLRLIASPDGADGSLTVHQDLRLFASLLEPGHEVRHDVASDRQVWLQVVDGVIEVVGQKLTAGDGLAVVQDASLVMQAKQQADFLLFDLARSN